MKKVISVLLTVALCLGMAAPAFAETDAPDEATREAYYAEYLKIAEEVNQERGTDIEVAPKEHFAEEDWRTPEEFRTFITTVAKWRIVFDQPGGQENTPGVQTKTACIEVGEKTYTLSLTCQFRTVLQGTRQFFDAPETVTSQMDGAATWTQTGYEAFLYDHGRSCEMVVSGVIELEGAIFRNRLCSAWFYCKANGLVT